VDALNEDEWKSRNGVFTNPIALKGGGHPIIPVDVSSPGLRRECLKTISSNATGPVSDIPLNPNEVSVSYMNSCFSQELAQYRYSWLKIQIVHNSFSSGMSLLPWNEPDLYLAASGKVKILGDNIYDAATINSSTSSDPRAFLLLLRWVFLSCLSSSFLLCF
jgi:hypothetical protein